MIFLVVVFLELHGPNGQVVEINPDEIHTPGIFVQRIIRVSDAKKHIEQRTTRKHTSPAAAAGEEI